MQILEYIIITIVAILVSPLLKGLVDKFVEEDKLEEEAEKKRELNKKLNNKEKIEKQKVKFKPIFDWKVTAVTVISEIILFLTFGFSFKFLLFAFLTLLLIVCMFSDIKGYIIPNEINFLGFIIGILYAFINMSNDINAGLNCLAGMIIGLVIFMAIAGLSMLVFKKEGMGGGDIKLMAVIGLYLGFFDNIQVFILSFFIAAIISIFLLVTKKKGKEDYIPFGPFIVMAAYITMLFPSSTIMPALINLIS